MNTGRGSHPISFIKMLRSLRHSPGLSHPQLTEMASGPWVSLALVTWTALCLAVIFATTTTAAFARLPADRPTVVTFSPSSAVAGAGFTLVVTGSNFDAGTTLAVNGVPLTTQSFSTTTLTGTAPLASFVTAGSYSVTVANAGGIVTATRPFAIAPSAATTLTITPAPVTVTAGMTQSIAAVVSDAYGNVRVQDVPSWQASGGSFSPNPGSTSVYAAPVVAGPYTIIATTGTLTKTAGVIVGPGAPVTIAMTPASAVALTLPSISQAFSAVVNDQYGNPTGGAIAWTASSGSFSPSASVSNPTWKAPSNAAPATYVVTASASNVTPGARSITISPGPAALLMITPTFASLKAGAAQSFTAASYDAYGNLRTADIATWQTSGGSFSDNPSNAPSYTASTLKGTYGVTASVGALTKGASIVVSPGGATQLTIVPGTASISSGGGITLTAYVSDTNGNPVPDGNVTWSVASGVGSVSSVSTRSAVYTSLTSGNAVITATLDAASGSANVSVSDGTATTLIITPSAVSMTAGSTGISLASTVYNENNVVMNSGTVVWDVTSGAGAVVSSTARLATFSSTQLGANTVRARFNGNLPQSLVNLSVIAGPAANLVITPTSTTLTPGATQPFTAGIYDSLGNLRTTDLPTWQASAGTFSSGAAPSAAPNYIAPTTAGSYAITATFGAFAKSAIIIVTPGKATQLAITPANASVVAGGSLALSASVSDDYGNPISDGNVTWLPTIFVTSGGTGRSATFATASAGAYVVTATYNSGAVVLTQMTTVTVNQGTATQLNIATSTTSAQAGNAIYLTATVLNENGVVMSAGNVTWSMTAGTGTVLATGSRTATFGSTLAEAKTIQAQFNGAALQNTVALTITPAGASSVIITLPANTLNLYAPVSAQTFHAIVRDAYNNDTGLSPDWSSASGVITGNGNTISYLPSNTPGTYYVTASYPGTTSWTRIVVVNTGPATGLSVQPASAIVAADSSTSFIATVTDGAGNVVTTGTVTWGPSGVITGTGNGRSATFAAGISGTYTVTGSFSDGTHTLAASAIVTVTPGAPAAITISPGTTSLTVATTRQFVATVSDIYGNPIAGQALTWTVSSPNTGVLRSTALDTAILTGSTRAGTYPNGVRVTNGILTGTATVTLVPDQLAQVLLSPNGTTLMPNGTQVFSAVAADQYQNPLSGYTFIWNTSPPSAGSVDPQAGSTTTFKASTTAGYYPAAVQAVVTSGNKHYTGAADITISPSAVVSIVVSPASASVSANSTQLFTAQAFDTFNNPIANAVFNWDTTGTGLVISTSGSSALVQAGTVAGVFADAVRAHINTVSGSSTLTVVPGSLDHIVLAPNIVALTVDSPQRVIATGYDEWNNTRSDLNVTWSVDVPAAGKFDSTLAASAVFRSGTTPGAYPHAIHAQSGSVAALANVVVYQGQVAKVKVVPAQATTGIGQTQLFTATVSDALDNPFPQLSVLWQLSPANIGSIVSSGPLTALVRMGTQAGTYVSGLQAFNGALSGSATLIVPASAAAAINISANPITLTTDGVSASTIVVTVTDQYGNAVGVGQAVSLVVDQCPPGGTCTLGTTSASTDAQGHVITTLRSNYRSITGTTSIMRVSASLASGVRKSVTIAGAYRPFRLLLPFLTRQISNNHDVCTAFVLRLGDTVSQAPSASFNLYRLSVTTATLKATISAYNATGTLILYQIIEDDCASTGKMQVQYVREVAITSNTSFVATFNVTPSQGYLLAVYTSAGLNTQPYVLSVAP